MDSTVVSKQEGPQFNSQFNRGPFCVWCGDSLGTLEFLLCGAFAEVLLKHSPQGRLWHQKIYSAVPRCRHLFKRLLIALISSVDRGERL